MNCASENNHKTPVRVKRSIGLPHAVALVVGSAVGSGVFVAPKEVFERAGSTYAAIVVWTLSGLFSLLGGLCFAELGTTVTRSGGEYAYLLEAFGPLPAFLHLWVALVVRQPASQAVVALTFAKYVLQPWFPEARCLTAQGPPHSAVLLVASLCIGLVTFVNCSSARCVMRVQIAFAAAKLVALAAVIIAGVLHLIRGGTNDVVSTFGAGTLKPHTLALAFYSSLFSYGGWHALNMVTEELVDPVRNLRRASCISISLITVFYVMVNVSYVFVLNWNELTGELVAVTFGERAFGGATWCMPIFVALSTMGSVNGMMFTAARVLMVGAQEGHLPQLLSMIHVRRCTPTPAVLLTGVASIATLVATDTNTLINYLSFGLWLTWGSCVAGMLCLRVYKPHLKRPIKVHISAPVVFICGCALLLVFPLVAEPVNAGAGAAITAAGLPVYWIVTKSSRRPPSAFGMQLTRHLQILLQVVPADQGKKCN